MPVSDETRVSAATCIRGLSHLLTPLAYVNDSL